MDPSPLSTQWMNVVFARISNVPGRGRGCEHGQCWETGHIMSVAAARCVQVQLPAQCVMDEQSHIVQPAAAVRRAMVA